MSPLRVPLRLMVDKLLEEKQIQMREGINGEVIGKPCVRSQVEPHNLVTLEPSHLTPSHGVPQGSPDCPQLGGVFCQFPIKERSAASATIYPYR